MSLSYKDIQKIARLFTGKIDELGDFVPYNRGECAICGTSRSTKVTINENKEFHLCSRHLKVFEAIQKLLSQDFRNLIESMGYPPDSSCCVCLKDITQRELGSRVVTVPLDAEEPYLTSSFIEGDLMAVVCAECDDILTNEIIHYPQVLNFEYVKCPKCKNSFSITTSEQDYEERLGLEGAIYCNHCFASLKNNAYFKAQFKDLSQDFTTRWAKDECGVCNKQTEIDVRCVGGTLGCSRCVIRDGEYLILLTDAKTNHYRYEIHKNNDFCGHFEGATDEVAFNKAILELIEIRKNDVKRKSNIILE